MTAEHLVLEQHRQHDDVGGRASPEPGGDLDVAGGDVRRARIGLRLERRLADQPLAELEAAARRRCGAGGVAVASATSRSSLPSSSRCSARKNAPCWAATSGVSSLMISWATAAQVAVALHQAGDAGQVGLQPVLLLVGPRRLAQVGDHLVDVVLELGDLAAGLDGDRPGQVALGHGGGHLGDRAHLGGQVAGQLVDVLGEPLPGARTRPRPRPGRRACPRCRPRGPRG